MVAIGVFVMDASVLGVTPDIKADILAARLQTAIDKLAGSEAF